MQSTANEITDNEILSLIQEATSLERGFKLLMQKYQERLYWHVRRMVYEHDDANDVIQNAFIKVYRSIQKFEGKSKLYTWLYRIATNEAITFINKKKRKATASLDDDEGGISTQLAADPYFDGDQVQLLLQKALETLPEKQRLVFNMRYYEEMAYKDIAEVLDTSVGALKASYHHAVKKIERSLRAADNY